MSTILLDFGRTILIILLLPLFVVLIGPLLVLAVFRGQQPLGPVILDTSRYNLAGKTGILMLGLAFWLLAWSGLAWLMLAALAGPPNLQVFQLRPTSVVSLATASSTPAIVSPTPAVPTATAPPSTVPPTETTVVAATPPGPTPAATDTPRGPDQAVEATATDTPAGTPAAVQARPTGETSPRLAETATPTVQLTPVEPDPSAALAVVLEANLLLKEAMNLPNEENLANLSTVWQDRALTKVERFATEQHDRYARRLAATFEFISPPTISDQVSPGQLVITARERWRYGQSVNADQEALEFVYTLNWIDERWIITRYTYRNLPRSAATAGVGRATVTTAPGSR